MTTIVSAEHPEQQPSLQPFTLQPVLSERIWGTSTLAPWHADPEAGTLIGEMWLTAEDCTLLDGPDQGKTLAQVTAGHPEAFGDANNEGFPLLIKLLFPREKLSVQVHPNDVEAQALGMPRGKTECWYALSAEPGAEIALGFKEPLAPEQVKAAIEAGTLEQELRMLPVHAGDMFFVDAGTIHAIGPGMVVLETQQYSDTTYRLWDYGRPRELHVEAGSAVTKAQTAAGLVEPRAMEGFTRLVESEYFLVDRFQPGDEVRALEHEDRLQILIALDDHCFVQAGTGESYPLARGKAVVVPAGSESVALQCEGQGQVIRVLQP